MSYCIWKKHIFKEILIDSETCETFQFAVGDAYQVIPPITVD